MSKLFIEDTTLTNIADAIRDKAGISDRMTPAEMPLIIQEISGGGAGDFEVTNGALARNFYSADGADIEPYTFVDYFEGGRKGLYTNYMTSTVTLSDGLKHFKCIPWGADAFLLMICDPSYQMRVARCLVDKTGSKINYGSLMSLGSAVQEHVCDVVVVNNTMAAALYVNSSGELKACLLTCSATSTYLTKKSEITVATGVKNTVGTNKIALGYEPTRHTLIAFYQSGATTTYPYAFTAIPISGTTITLGKTGTYNLLGSSATNTSILVRAEFLPIDKEGQLLLVIDGRIGGSATYSSQYNHVFVVDSDPERSSPMVTQRTLRLNSLTNQRTDCNSAVSYRLSENRYIHCYQSVGNSDGIYMTLFSTYGMYGPDIFLDTKIPVDGTLAEVLQAVKIDDDKFALVYGTTNDGVNKLHISTFSYVLADYDSTITQISTASFDMVHSDAWGAFLTPWGPNTLAFCYASNRNPGHHDPIRKWISYDADGVLTVDENYYPASGNMLLSSKNNTVGIPMEPNSEGRFIYPTFYDGTNQLYTLAGSYFEKSTVKACTSQTTVPVGTALGITKTKCGVDVPGTIYKYIK